MQNRDKGRSDEDRSRSERSHEPMRGNVRPPSDEERSYQDRSPRTPEGEQSDIERSSSTGRRHIPGEGESIEEESIDSSDLPSDGSRGGSRRDERGNGRVGNK